MYGVYHVSLNNFQWTVLGVFASFRKRSPDLKTLTVLYVRSRCTGSYEPELTSDLFSVSSALLSAVSFPRSAPKAISRAHESPQHERVHFIWLVWPVVILRTLPCHHSSYYWDDDKSALGLTGGDSIKTWAALLEIFGRKNYFSTCYDVPEHEKQTSYTSGSRVIFLLCVEIEQFISMTGKRKEKKRKVLIVPHQLLEISRKSLSLCLTRY